MPTDFGSDISTFPDLDPTFTLITGNRVVAEAIARRWTTSAGTYLPDPSYGWNATQLLNVELSPVAQSSAINALVSEALRDERVIACTVGISSDGSGNVLLTGSITTASGPFALVLQIGAVTNALLQPS